MLPRIPDTPPRIAALTEAEKSDQPVWSVMIPVYNCVQFLPETLQSVLEQGIDPTKMQIEVVDDASTDGDIASLVLRIGKGRIGYYRQENNVGSLRNFETCLNRSRGKLIHLLHGDDKVLPGFYQQLQILFENYPAAGAAFSRYYYMNEQSAILYPADLEMPASGLLSNWLERLAQRQRIQTPAIAVRREVYEQLGGFYAVHYGEDWEMWVRIAAHYPMAYTPEILAAYRQHEASITGRFFLDGGNIRDLKKVMRLNAEHLPRERKAVIQKEAEKFYAYYAIGTARMLWHKYKNRAASEAQLREARSLYRSPGMLLEIFKLKLKFLLNIR